MDYGTSEMVARTSDYAKSGPAVDAKPLLLLDFPRCFHDMKSPCFEGGMAASLAQTYLKQEKAVANFMTLKALDRWLLRIKAQAVPHTARQERC